MWGSNPGPLDSETDSRGPGLDPDRRHRVVPSSTTHYLPTALVKPRKRWLRPDMTEKLLTGTLSFNTSKQIYTHRNRLEA